MTGVLVLSFYGLYIFFSLNLVFMVLLDYQFLLPILLYDFHKETYMLMCFLFISYLDEKFHECSSCYFFVSFFFQEKD